MSLYEATCTEPQLLAVFSYSCLNLYNFPYTNVRFLPVTATHVYMVSIRITCMCIIYTCYTHLHVYMVSIHMLYSPACVYGINTHVILTCMCIWYQYTCYTHLHVYMVSIHMLYSPACVFGINTHVILTCMCIWYQYTCHTHLHVYMVSMHMLYSPACVYDINAHVILTCMCIIMVSIHMLYSPSCVYGINTQCYTTEYNFLFAWCLSNNYNFRSVKSKRRVLNANPSSDWCIRIFP